MCRTYDRRVLIAIVTLFVALPLSLLRKVSSLRFTGFLSIMFVCFFVVTLLVRSMEKGVAVDVTAGGGTDMFTFFRGLTIMAYAFANQKAVFPVFHEMHTRTAAAFEMVVTRTHVVAFCVYCITGYVVLRTAATSSRDVALCVLRRLAGYVMFGAEVKGNVLLEFAGSSDRVIALVSVYPT
jgi:amino acid permease